MPLGFLTIKLISLSSESLVISQEGLCCMDLEREHPQVYLNIKTERRKRSTEETLMLNGTEI
jgi:hypothetical protein